MSSEVPGVGEQGRVAKIQSYSGLVTDRPIGSGGGKEVRNTHRECVEGTRRKQGREIQVQITKSRG